MKSKEEALATITHHTRCINNQMQEVWECFIGRNMSTGKVVRFSHLNKDDLLARIEQFYAERRKSGDAACILRPSQMYDAAEAYALLERAGKRRHLADVVVEWLMGDSASGARIVPLKKISIGEAYNQYYGSFNAEQIAHRKAIASRTGKWVESIGGRRMADSITADETVKWIDRHCSGTDKTWNNAFCYIKSFLQWCAAPERKYIAENPLANIKPRKLAYVEPQYMAAGDVRRIMSALEDMGDGAAITFAALSFFCGVRTEEIKRISEDDFFRAVCLADGTVRIGKVKGYLQGMGPRVFHATDTAMAWIRAYGADGSLRGRNIAIIQRHIASAALALGIRLCHNAGRHSFITHHVAAYADPQRTEAMVGTSAAMRCSHYMGLVTRSEGEAYFAILPRGAGAAR